MDSSAVKAKAAMLIRKPVAEVFEAFVNPAITTQFWFTKSSGRLEPGKTVRWEWEMYNVSTEVTVKAVEPNKRILIEWSGYSKPNEVEWVFKELPEGTFVEIINSGFGGDDNQLVQEALDSTGGFTLVIAGVKALLEHNIRLNLVGDRFPKGIE